MRIIRIWMLCLLGFSCLAHQPAAAAEARLKALFLGDNGLHQPFERALELVPALANMGIDIQYTDDLNELETSNLNRYDCLVVYANHEKISPEQEAALLGYVEGGHGLVALHSASYCFLNSDKYTRLVGAQFRSHETGEFQTKITAPDHPAIKGIQEFTAWDETYTHHRLGDDLTVLMVREDKDRQEPWTWVRTQGQGRVFYTASGHDERVWTKPEFHKLVAQGIRWAAGQPDFKFEPPRVARLPAKLPNYTPGEKWGTQGEAITDMQAPLSPEESMRHMSVPGGFKLELFAAEPDIVKPISITWDFRGRAWIAETVDYPNDLQDDGEGHDQIKICEDTDADGRADKFTVFADKLSIPTSLVHTGDGVIVAQAPHMLYLRDTDGDDKVDERKILFTGFGTKDTHAGPSNLRLGLDNWVYGTVGYSGFVGEVGGKAHKFSQGVFRFQEDGSKLEFLGSSSNNTWGLGFNETGEVFYSTANNDQSCYLAIPNRYFESVRGWLGKGTALVAQFEKMHPFTTSRQMDNHGKYTAAAGHSLYTARQFPKKYWNAAAFICEPTGHLVSLAWLKPDGSGYVAEDGINLLASTDEWSSPIVAEVGPDGSVWIIDWYNYIIQHNPTPTGYKTGKGGAYVTPLRDKTHGRIYRLSDAGAPRFQSANLASASPLELVALLKSDNLFWRLAAQWKLVSRGNSDVVPALRQLALSKEVDGIGESPAVLHALWVLKGLGALNGDDSLGFLAPLLAHPAPGVRKVALVLLPKTAEATDAVLTAGLLNDPSALLRREALLALSQLPSSQGAGLAIAEVLQTRADAEDPWIVSAATCAAARDAEGFLTDVLTKRGASGPKLRAAETVAEHLARSDSNDAALKPLALAPLAEPAAVEAVLSGLATGWPRNLKLDVPEELQAKLAERIDSFSRSGQVNLFNLAVRWGIGERFGAKSGIVREQLLETVSNEGLRSRARIAAAQQLADLDPDSETVSALLDHVSPRQRPALSAAILKAVGSAKSADVPVLLIERWQAFTPTLRLSAVDSLLKRREWSLALLDAIDAGEIEASDLSPDQFQQLTNHPDLNLAEHAQATFARGGRLPNPDREKVFQELLALTEQTGDVEHGRQVFQTNCAKCHRYGDIGEEIGPELTGFGVHPKSKTLHEIIDPNASVEGNFRQYSVITMDGQVLSGLLASETQTAIELVDTQAQRHVVLRDEIDQMAASTSSIMPEGFEKQLKPEEIADLLEFIIRGSKL